MPLACVPDAIPATERTTHFERLRRLFDTRMQERVDLYDGIAFRFPADALDEVSAFVALERRCCPFLRFRVETGRADGAVRLRMQGPPGTSSFLEAELGLVDTSAR